MHKPITTTIDRMPITLGNPPRSTEPDFALTRYRQLLTVADDPEQAVRLIGEWAQADWCDGSQAARDVTSNQHNAELRLLQREFGALVDHQIKGAR